MNILRYAHTNFSFPQTCFSRIYKSWARWGSCWVHCSCYTVQHNICVYYAGVSADGSGR